MPLDLLQIALEHHRAGRLTQAETGYRAALAGDPENADAMHWLGVLLQQAEQFEQAIPLLRSAAEKRPQDSAFQHNLGQAYLSVGKKDDAIACFERAVNAGPDGNEALLALAQTRLSRGAPGDAESAVAALRARRDDASASPEILHHLGLALSACRKFKEAMEALRAALLLRPDDAMTFYHLALASRGAGELKETRKALIKALEIDPAMAHGWCALAMLDAEAGNYSSAAGLCRRAIAADRDSPGAYELLARILNRAGKRADAQAASEQARRLSLQRGEAQLDKPSAGKSVADLERHLTPTSKQAQAHFAMAALLNFFPPMQIPNESVSTLFDRYAPMFDSHLVGQLKYDVPENLIAAFRRMWDGCLLDVLDAGCGTGLCGPLLRPLAKTLAGVDLSSAMIEKARERGIYDSLEVGDLLAALRRSPGAYDFLICTDVLIYLGEAVPFFESAVGALRPGGILAYSVESAVGDRFELVPHSRRFRHSQPYLQRLAMMYGLEELHFETVVIRKERDLPVSGYLVILKSAE